MSYIVHAGNLASTPELHTSENGRSYCHGTVIVDDRERAEDGSYCDQRTIVYSLTVFGSAAEQLVETAQASGNVRVLFAGSYRVRGYDRPVGGTGISHNVMVDEIDVSLTGQRVVDWSRRRNGGEA